MVVVPGLSIYPVTINAKVLEDIFSAFTDDYTVYVFDIRDDVPENYSIQTMSEDLVSKITSLGLHDIYFYGCSMGGMQSLYIAGTHPDLVAKVVVAASACKANETSNAVVNNWLKLAKEKKYHELTADMGQKIYSAAVYGANEKAFSDMADGLNDEVVARFINTASVIPNFDITEQVAAISCPVLVFGSKGDQVLTGQAAEEIAEITGGELYMYGEDSPHAIFDEVPDLKVRAKEFFDKE